MVESGKLRNLLAGLGAFGLLSALPTAVLAQAPANDVPFERRAANSPVSVPTDEAMAHLPQFLVDPFWPKPLPNNWLLGQVAGLHVDRDDNV